MKVEVMFSAMNFTEISLVKQARDTLTRLQLKQ